MPCSGCSALHGVNPNKKKEIKSWHQVERNKTEIRTLLGSRDEVFRIDVKVMKDDEIATRKADLP